MLVSLLVGAFLPIQIASFHATVRQARNLPLVLRGHEPALDGETGTGRRQALRQGAGLFLGGVAGLWGNSFPSQAATGPSDGNLPDLPNEAVRSYLQYRGPLQTSTDFYLFDLYDTLKDPSDWGNVGELFQSKPTRIEREFTNVMRVVGLSMPPDEAEEMRAAQYDFEKAMEQLKKITLGIRRDLPVELDANIVSKARAAWDDGRVGLNKFLSVLNVRLFNIHGALLLCTCTSRFSSPLASHSTNRVLQA
jgi:hypothetical protein